MYGFRGFGSKAGVLMDFGWESQAIVRSKHNASREPAASWATLGSWFIGVQSAFLQPRRKGAEAEAALSGVQELESIGLGVLGVEFPSGMSPAAAGHPIKSTCPLTHRRWSSSPDLGALMITIGVEELRWGWWAGGGGHSTKPTYIVVARGFWD